MVKLARGRRHASADARATLSTFGGSSLLSLESRIMFDGAAVATVSTVTTEQIAQSQAEAFFSADDGATADSAPAAPAPTGEPQPTTGDQALFDALALYDTSVARQEILFLSPSVLDYQKLLDGISPNVEVIVLNPTRDGVEQMAETLAGRTGIDAVHLIGHGTEAEMQLGTSFLTQESISTRYAEQFQQIGQSLSADADILIYGCNFGRGEAGLNAIQSLAALTGADVAASTDRTGHASLGGDWELEYHTGQIETDVAVSTAFQEEWVGLLPTYTEFTNYTATLEIKSDANHGQTFTYTSGSGTYIVNQISLALHKESGAVAQTITVQLRDSWNGTVFGTATIAESALTTSSAWYDLSFADVNLNDGQSYTIRVSSDTTSGQVHVGFNSSGGYSGGNRIDTSGAPLVGEDVAFKVGYTGASADPTIMNLSGDSLAYSEGDGAVVIEQGGNATVSDVDSADFNTGTLTVSFTNGSIGPVDILAIRNEGAGAGQIGVSGANVTYGGVTIGTFTGGAGGSDLVITLNSSATPTAVTALVKNITYENTDTGAPTTGARTVRYVLTDGDGGTSANYNTTVTVSGVNDLPGGLPTITGTVTEDQTLTAVTAGISDADGLGAFSYQWLRNGVAVGGATASTYLLGQADVGALMTVQVTYTDAQGTAEGPLTSAPTAAVANLNDAPAIASNGGGATASVSVLENTTAVTTVTSTDPDGGGPAYSIVGGVDAARFTINGGSGILQFTVAPDYEVPADVGGNNVYVVTIQVDDGAGGMDQQTLTITIADVAEGLPPTPSLPPIPPSLVPQTPAPPSSGPPANGPPVPPAPIVVGTPIPGPQIPAAAWLGNSPSGSVQPTSEAPAAPALGGGNTPGPSVPLMGELRGYLEERVTPLIHQAGEEVQKAFGGQTLEEAPAQLSAAFRKTLKTFEEDLQRAVGTSESQRQLIVHVKTVGGVTLTAGLVTWLLRSGSLLVSLATNLPAWRHLDPLSVVLVSNRERRKRERDAAAAAQLEDKQFRGLGTLLDHEGDRPGQGGKAA